jgi:hypothetical protein
MIHPKRGGHPFGLNIRYPNEFYVKRLAEGQSMFVTLNCGFKILISRVLRVYNYHTIKFVWLLDNVEIIITVR